MRLFHWFLFSCHPSCRLLPPPHPTTASWFSEDKGFGHSLLTCHWFSFYTYSYQGGSMLSLIRMNSSSKMFKHSLSQMLHHEESQWWWSECVPPWWQDDMLQHPKVVTISLASIHHNTQADWVTSHVSRVTSQHRRWWSPDDSRINPPSDKHSLTIFCLHSQMSSKQFEYLKQNSDHLCCNVDTGDIYNIILKYLQFSRFAGTQSMLELQTKVREDFTIWRWSLLGPFPGWKHLYALSHLTHYSGTLLDTILKATIWLWSLCHCPNFTTTYV